MYARIGSLCWQAYLGLAEAALLLSLLLFQTLLPLAFVDNGDRASELVMSWWFSFIRFCLTRNGPPLRSVLLVCNGEITCCWRSLALKRKANMHAWGW